MTTSGYGLSGIGLDPMGYTGLGVPGQYSSSLDSYMPSMAAYNPAFSGMNMGMASGMLGMGGMMNPMFGMMGGINNYTEYLTKYQDAINQMELNRADHISAMHKKTQENEALALKNSRISYMSQHIALADEHQAIEHLYEVVKSGNQDAICKQFDATKDLIINKYRDELGANGDKTNIDQAAIGMIKNLYSQIISAKTGEIADLESDIKRFGDGHIANGFMKGFRKGHHEKYVDETLCHCFGTTIDRKASKDRINGAMKYTGYAGAAVEGLLAGGVAGAALVVLGKGFTKKGSSFRPHFTGGKGGSWFGRLGRGGKFALIAGLAAAVGNTIWKAS